MTRVHTPGCPSVSSSCSASCCYFRGAAGGWMKCLPARRHGMCLACVLRHSVVSDSATPRTVDHQAPLSMAFSRQEYQSGLPCPPPRHLPHSGAEPTSLKPPALVGEFFATSSTCPRVLKSQHCDYGCRLWMGLGGTDIWTKERGEELYAELSDLLRWAACIWHPSNLLPDHHPLSQPPWD